MQHKHLGYARCHDGTASTNTWDTHVATKVFYSNVTDSQQQDVVERTHMQQDQQQYWVCVVQQ